MKHYLFFIVLLGVQLSSFSQDAELSVSDLNSFNWKLNWSTAKGEVKTGVQAAPNSKELPLEVKVNFETGFQYFNYGLDSEIPGKIKGLRLQAKKNSEAPVAVISFTVKNPEKGKKYQWNLPLSSEWEEYKFSIPKDWPQVTGVGITTHNWARQDKAHEVSFSISDLIVITDVSEVEHEAELLKVTTSTGRPRNIFLHNEKIGFEASFINWTGKKQNATVHTNAYYDGKLIFENKEDILLDGALKKNFNFDPNKYGIYQVGIEVHIDGAPISSEQVRCAYIPPIAETTPQERRNSPWAINIHGGIEGVAYDSIAKLGFCWVRDYAYTYDWITRGYNNGKWDEWPWYLTMDQKLEESGLFLLPCMVKGFEHTIKKYPEPPKEWKNTLLQFMMKFPRYDAFEPDNELDLHIPRELEADNYQSYGKYHAHFASVVHMMDKNAWAVTQGTAGLKADIVEQMVQQGYFKDFDAINGHFYTGIYPALLARQNANTGQGGEKPEHFYDSLRHFVAASDSDGKDRQSWITEFGWDTLAVQIVSEKEQAAYAQRGFTLGLVAGIDKMFWYWNLDTTKEVPDTYFDGMGIFDPKRQPKPVAAAIASMIHFLKSPEPVGSFDLGPNTYGHIFHDRGEYIALAFKIDKDKPASSYTFLSGNLFDLYGNSLLSRQQELDITPIWIKGLQKTDPIFESSIFSLNSKWLETAAAGDELKLEVGINNYLTKIVEANLKIELPEGWELLENTENTNVSIGEQKSVPFRVQIPKGTERGTYDIVVNIKTETSARRLLMQVDVSAPVTSNALYLEPTSGTSKLVMKIENHSQKTRSFIVDPVVPKDWNVAPASMRIKELAPGEKANIHFDINWQPLGQNDYASMQVKNENGELLHEESILTGTRYIGKVKDIQFNGDFSDWPKDTQIPLKHIGELGEISMRKLYLGYNAEGIYIGLEIEGSDAIATEPKTFWSMDAIEILIDTANNKTPRNNGYQHGDHQFWFVPVVDKHNTYLGRWKRNNEITETQYDLKHPSFTKKTESGYILEAMIPIEFIDDFKAEKGQKLGFSFLLQSPGSKGKSQSYWPLPKASGVVFNPQLWGELILN